MRRGVTSSPAALALALSNRGIVAAPAGLAADVARNSCIAGLITTGVPGTAVILTTTSFQKVIVAAAAAAMLGVFVYRGTRSADGLRPATPVPTKESELTPSPVAALGKAVAASAMPVPTTSAVALIPNPAPQVLSTQLLELLASKTAELASLSQPFSLSSVRTPPAGGEFATLLARWGREDPKAALAFIRGLDDGNYPPPPFWRDLKTSC